MNRDTHLKITKRLDAGGMAEVFLGELVGAEGISKRVAIKRILPNLSKHGKFVAMFLDEARLAMKLSHANVVQTFEVGVRDDTYYIVMEFIEGTSLKALMNHYKDKGMFLPLGVSIYIIMEAAKGLGYAHREKDGDGHPLNLVHRDVSPPNILLSVQGEVKVVDFGLAKAASQIEDTEPGVIKGKFSYLSPEAVMGLEVDSRADVFSLGIVLFELLSNRRLFYGATDLETVQFVEKAFVPRVSAINPEVPQALEKILQKALSRDREKRYQKCEDFIDDLNSILFTYGLKVSNRDVAKLVRKIKGGFAEEEESGSKEDFDFKISDFTADLSGDFTNNPKVSRPENLEVFDDTEDPRSWLDDMGLDGFLDDFGLEENKTAMESSPEEQVDEELLSDDLIEEVLEIEPDEELEIMEEEQEEEVVVSGTFDSSVVRKLNEGDEKLHIEEEKKSEQAKKNWFSRLFGGEK
ncbi:MAG: serine/threonine protein kinase [Deltaproteobacteria bacterium]|nr:serine/threonine protein kinase [Deltaproteobacteria bacterium]